MKKSALLIILIILLIAPAYSVDRNHNESSFTSFQAEGFELEIQPIRYCQTENIYVNEEYIPASTFWDRRKFRRSVSLLTLAGLITAGLIISPAVTLWILLGTLVLGAILLGVFIYYLSQVRIC